jgi:hypothetical protein
MIEIILLAYVVNIFLNRWLNKIAYKKGYCEILVWAWFIPILPSVAILTHIIASIEIKGNWFNGKNWDDE